MYDYLIEIQPNRDPFLFINKVVECNEEKNSKTIMHLNKDEWFFKCHWENDPNMPAMLQLETMSQTASLCLFSKLRPPKKLYLTRIESASFRKKIVPEPIIASVAFCRRLINIWCRALSLVVMMLALESNSVNTFI